MPPQSTAPTLGALARMYAETKNIRQQLENKVKELKDAEMQLQKRILLEMSAEGLTTSRYEGIGRLSITNRNHYEIADIEVLIKKMVQTIGEAVQNNRPWADGLLLQQRVHAGNLDDYIADMKAASPGLTDEDLYKQFGVRKVTEKVVSLTKN